MLKKIRAIGILFVVIGLALNLLFPLFIPELKPGRGMGYINIVMGVAMIAWSYYSAYATKKFVKESLPTIGTVLSIRQTGTYINKQPRIEFTVEIIMPDGAVVQGRFKKVISLIEMARFTEGMKVPIRYKKDDPSKMAFDVSSSQEEMQEAYNQALIQRGELDPELLEIGKNGLPGQAIIMESRPTGKLLNKQVEMHLRLAVTGDNGETFDVEFTRGVNRQIVTALQVGAVVQVHYLQYDHSKIAITTRANV